MSKEKITSQAAIEDKEDDVKGKVEDKITGSIKEEISSHMPGGDIVEQVSGKIEGLLPGGEGGIASDIEGAVGEAGGGGGGIMDTIEAAGEGMGEEGELATACEVIGLGPEDPLADACAALVVAGFTIGPPVVHAVEDLAGDASLPDISLPKDNLPSISIPKPGWHMPSMPDIHFPHVRFPHLHFPHFNIHIPKIFQFSRHPWVWTQDGKCPSPLPWNDPTPSEYQDIPPDPGVDAPMGGGVRRRRRRKTRRRRRRARRNTRRR